ncbi:two-component system alkaline phosphatase synthesis response regulator PhoP [Natranaerovirga hydrolytica]|uniref:Stage 0 sporulation protein A homolog n=1 Tax=Natranaerovirga hydrolytica TaxID=680378 RepID=A0A4R1MS87_9FIRM|nr:response regulator transcription factor [Natranaerovirga hydrolytica]TCK92783.1 two-component system alkaline phosphatase synthesis response regulator PhoP [Natranaerovirga hydrolytica]
MKDGKILIVEDEKVTLKLITQVLQKYGFNIITAMDESSTIEMLNKEVIKGIILDLNLPDTNGLDLLQIIRNHHYHKEVPIIILTSNDDKIDEVVALEMGADDYITKPFYHRELVARLKACIRRAKPTINKKENLVQVDNLEIDLDTRQVKIEKEIIPLTFKEFEVLAFLSMNPGKVFSRDQLLTTIWGDQYITETRTIDIHISSLRSKLGKRNNDKQYIETVRGVGYRFRN